MFDNNTVSGIGIEPNETTYTAMENAEKAEDLYGPFDSVESLMEMLNGKPEFAVPFGGIPD